MLSGGAPVLQLAGVEKTYTLRRGFLRAPGHIHAVNGVDLEVKRNETLGLVGESGCGKSTLSRLITNLERPSAGAIRIDGKNIAAARGSELKSFRSRVQMVFQDPYTSLNPRMSVGRIVEEPLSNFSIGTGAERRDRVKALFRQVGLPPESADAYPHEFSGGQRQRIAIARALSLEPEIVVADEPVSALDVSVQAQVLNLIMDLQQRAGLTLIFVSHDLSVIRHVSHRIAVMYLGRIVEIADKGTLFREPQHPYTRALLDAVPPTHPRLRRSKALLAGDPPSVTAAQTGCAFRGRCPLAIEQCAVERPVLRDVGGGSKAACHRAGEID
jgi:oligopeptide/dipeptide ABC transporter ATP-binding protein